MEIEPSISLIVNGEPISLHHLEVLRAVHEEGSQKRAAERLRISTPVLHRYLRKVEERVGTRMLITSPLGTKLTPEGGVIVFEYLALRARMKRGDTTVVGGSIVTEDLLLSVLSKIDRVGRYDLIISDDERNLRDLQAGLMDLVVLDDPLYVYDLEGVYWEEVAEDDLVHVDRGSNYLRFKYGAQRIGFRDLESRGVRHKVKGVVRHLPALLDSNLSFFVNQSLLSRKGIRMRSATEPRLLRHKILAVYRKEDGEVSRLIRELRRHRLL